MCVLYAHMQFSSLRHLCMPTAIMALLHRASPNPQISLPCQTQVNSQMQHTCILTSHPRLHTHTLPEPPITFLPLSLTNTPDARSGAELQIRPSWHLSLLFTMSLAFQPQPLLHLRPCILWPCILLSFWFFFCLVNKCIGITHSL